jgi:Ran GTPase-activating protein (RanGAP) involved in mRNA processing and transport
MQHDVSHQIESASDHSHKGLNDENIIVICHGIRNVKSLDTINFSYNRISGKGCQNISKLIQHNSNILHLDLSGNVKIQSNGVAYLTKGFQHLLELNLSKCRLNNEAAVLLCDGLITNKSIETLILAHNDISDRGAKDIGKMLPRHPNLRDLILKWNMIGNEGAAAIGYGLRDTRCKLENLDLSFNGFGGGVGNKNAALEFSQALFTNKHLHHLNLAHNRLTRHDIYIILRRIDRDNDTLLCVHRKYYLVCMF